MVIDIFPTTIFMNELKSDMTVLKDCVDRLREEDPKGKLISNVGGWQKHGIEREDVFKPVINEINDILTQEVLGHYGIKGDLSVGNMWANVNGKGDWNTPHIHTGCWYSGVFYIDDGGRDGSLEFYNTNPMVFSDYPITRKNPTSMGYSPRTARLIMFPSGLLHMVTPKTGERLRYSVAFNTQLKKWESL